MFKKIYLLRFRRFVLSKQSGLNVRSRRKRKRRRRLNPDRLENLPDDERQEIPENCDFLSEFTLSVLIWHFFTLAVTKLNLPNFANFLMSYLTFSFAQWLGTVTGR